MSQFQFVTLVNRTKDTLQGTWNGRHYDIMPGESHYPEAEAQAFRRQNIVMGSEDPRTGKITYKLGIREYGEPCSPLDPEVLAGDKVSVERWDRTKLTGSKPSEVVAGDNGIYSARQVAADLPFDSSFVKP